MVSSSRKKNKGKDRKAKKVEAERARVRNTWLGWATGDKKVMGKAIKCNHGCGVLPSDVDHPVMRFIDEMFTPDSSVHSFMDMFQTTLGEVVLNDERYREILINIFIRMGTNKLLNEEYDGALTLAATIAPLEIYDDMSSLSDVTYSRRVQTKIRDLNKGTSSIRRDCLKFFSKRVSCYCLKSMHQKARRTQPKMGLCGSNQMDRVALSVCSRCMIVQYCSRECCVANWPEHKEVCGHFVNAHQQQLAAEDSVHSNREGW